jgi:hypothetical protein
MVKEEGVVRFIINHQPIAHRFTLVCWIGPRAEAIAEAILCLRQFPSEAKSKFFQTLQWEIVH